MSNPSSFFNTPLTAPPLPLHDKRVVEMEALQYYLPATKLFLKATSQERETMLEIIHHHLGDKPTLEHTEVLQAIAAAAEYVDRYKNSPDALKNIDLRLLDKTVSPSSTIVACTVASMIFATAGKNPQVAPPHP